MSEHKYTIISGYYHRPNDAAWANWFYGLWSKQLPLGARVIVITNGCCHPPRGHGGHVIPLEGDLGHVHDLIGKSKTPKPHSYCGWSATVLAGAMLAYANETDMVFCEQDCLMFGDCIEEMYRQMGDRSMIFGKSKHMACAQSLFLIRHSFIPLFVLRYLAMPDDRRIDWLGEIKFMQMMHDSRGNICQFDFGCDRDRPIPWDDPVFYFQKARPDELLEAERRGLLTLPPNMPADVKVFTNDTTGL